MPDLKAMGAAPLGALFILAAAVSWGAGTALVKYFRWTMPVIVLTGWQLALGSLPVIAGAFLLEDVSILAQISGRAWLAMLYVVLFPMIFCHWAWFSVVSLFPAGVATIGTLAMPVIGVLSSTLMLGEALGIQEISALTIVVMSVGFVSEPPHLSVSDLVKSIKGEISRNLLMDFKPLNRQFWGCHLWARGYFVAGSGNVTDEVIMKYIEQQGQEPADAEF